MLAMSNDAEREYVEEQIAAMKREGELRADMVAAFLKSNGYKPCRSNEDQTPASPEQQQRVKTFLLELGAALRIRSFHAKKITANIPITLPSTDEAMRQAAVAATAGAELKLTPAVFWATSRYLVAQARPMLDADVVMANHPGPSDDFLDRFASFLWERRGLSQQGDKDANS